MSSTDWWDKGRVEKAHKDEVEGLGEDSYWTCILSARELPGSLYMVWVLYLA